MSVLARLRWQDVADIAILTFVLWRLYVWLRGTVALQVAIGMLTLVVASMAARATGLVLTAYVLQGIGAVAVLIAVVIFRDEIRRALGRASPLRWWRERRDGGPAAAVSPGTFGPLAEGAFLLARKRTGALVVIPRRDPVEEHLTGGTPVDGITTPQLLEAIFHPGSPVHDGAAIVEGERLRVAGAFLPLSPRPDLPEAFGTRHRAAVGISEACDAIALVVSEERGEVSLAEGGRIAPVPSSAAALSKRLTELVRETPPPRRPATEAVRRRQRRQAIRDALVGAAILAGVVAAWDTIAGERGSVIVKTVPVELRGAGAELQFEPPRPNQVEVHLRGPRRLLLSLAPEDLRTSIDLAGLRPGQHELVVSASAPAGIEVVRVSPAKVKVKVKVK